MIFSIIEYHKYDKHFKKTFRLVRNGLNALSSYKITSFQLWTGLESTNDLRLTWVPRNNRILGDVMANESANQDTAETRTVQDIVCKISLGT